MERKHCKALISLGTHSVAIISILPDSFMMTPSRLKLSSSLFVALMNDGYHVDSIYCRGRIATLIKQPFYRIFYRTLETTQHMVMVMIMADLHINFIFIKDTMLPCFLLVNSHSL